MSLDDDSLDCPRDRGNGQAIIGTNPRYSHVRAKPMLGVIGKYATHNSEDCSLYRCQYTDHFSFSIFFQLQKFIFQTQLSQTSEAGEHAGIIRCSEPCQALWSVNTSFILTLDYPVIRGNTLTFYPPRPILILTVTNKVSERRDADDEETQLRHQQLLPNINCLGTVIYRSATTIFKFCAVLDIIKFLVFSAGTQGPDSQMCPNICTQNNSFEKFSKSNGYHSQVLRVSWNIIGE